MKGLAHIGVLQALLERGHRPTRIIGSSVGALVGASWAGGVGIAKLREIALSLKRKDVFAVAHADMAFKRMRSPALFKREPLEHLIARTVGDLTFQQLDPPVVVNTVDLNSGMQVFWGLPGLDDIRVADAVFASCALPGYFPPHEIGGRFYVDGAVVSNVPFYAARAPGAAMIIAADVSANSVLTADAQDEGFAGVFARATEILMTALLAQRVRTWTSPPVYYIQPRVEHATMFSFAHLREAVEEGDRATSTARDRQEEWPEPDDVGIYPKRRVVVRVERERCIGCGTCLVHGPQGMFVLDSDRKAVVTQPDQEWSPMDGGYIRHCPTYAIIARPAQQENELRRSGSSASRSVSLIDLHQIPHHSVPVEITLDRPSPCRPQSSPALGIRQQPVDALREGLWIVWIDQNPRLVFPHRIRHATRAPAHDGEPARRRFDERDAESFRHQVVAPRRADVEVGRVVQRGELVVRQGPEKSHRVAKAEVPL